MCALPSRAIRRSNYDKRSENARKRRRYILQTSHLATLDFRERRYVCAVLILVFFLFCSICSICSHDHFCWTSTVFLFDATFHSISLRKVLLLQKADTGNKNNTRTRHFIQDHALFWSSIAEEKLEINWKEKVSNWRLQSLRAREIIN